MLKELAIVGTKYRGAAAIETLRHLQPGASVELRRDAGNKHDAFAVKCFAAGLDIGWLPKGLNVDIAQVMDAGQTVTGTVVKPADVRGNFIAREALISIEYSLS